jgi:hypothetical protein
MSTLLESLLSRKSIIFVTTVVLSALFLFSGLLRRDPYMREDRRYRDFKRRQLAPRQQLQRVVDGLRNEDVVMVVASTSRDSGKYLRDRYCLFGCSRLDLISLFFI